MKISIIVPVFNVEKYLDRSLSSIQNQSYKNWECIVINDGSTDNSRTIIEKYAKIDSRFILVNQMNLGSGKARSRGLKLSSGEYICFVDPDDYLDESALEKNVELLNSSKVDLLVNGYYEITQKGIKEKKHRITGFFEQFDFRNMFEEYSKVGVSSLWNKLYKRESILNNNIDFSDLKTGQDAVFNYNFYCNLESVLITNDMYYYYDKTRDSSVINSYIKNRFLCRTKITESIEEMVKVWRMENDFHDLIIRSKWQVLYFELMNISLSSCPLSFKEKLSLIKKISKSEFVKIIFQTNYSNVLGSRSSKVLYLLLFYQRYSLSIIVSKFMLKIFN